MQEHPLRTWSPDYSPLRQRRCQCGMAMLAIVIVAPWVALGWAIWSAL